MTRDQTTELTFDLSFTLLHQCCTRVLVQLLEFAGVFGVNNQCFVFVRGSNARILIVKYLQRNKIELLQFQVLMMHDLVPVQAMFSPVLERSLQKLQALKTEFHALWPLPISFSYPLLKLFHRLSIEDIHVSQQGEVESA